MRENQTSINEWKIATFGEYGKPERTAVRANEEFVEFMRSWTTDQPAPIELADTALVLYALAHRWEVDLDRPTWQNGLRYWGKHTIVELLSRATHTMATIISCTLEGEPAYVSLIDMFHLLSAIAHELGFNLCQLIDDKMVINRRRTWKVVDGHGYHVRDKSEGAAA